MVVMDVSGNSNKTWGKKDLGANTVSTWNLKASFEGGNLYPKKGRLTRVNSARSTGARGGD